MNDLSEDNDTILSRLESGSSLSKEELGAVDMDNLQWCGLGRLATAISAADSNAGASELWTLYIQSEDPGACFLAGLQAVQGTGGTDQGGIDEYDERHAAALPSDSAPSLESSVLLLASLCGFLVRQRGSKRVVQLVTDARVAVEQLHDRLADLEGGVLDPNRRYESKIELFGVSKRILPALATLVMCAAAVCQLMGEHRNTAVPPPLELAKEALTELRGGKLLPRDTAAMSSACSAAPADRGSSDSAPPARGARSEGKLRHAVARFCQAVGGFFCHASVREATFAAAGLDINPEPSPPPPAAGPASGAGDSAKGPSEPPPVLVLLRALLSCCAATGLTMSSSMAAAPPSGAGIVPEALRDLPGSFVLAAPVLRAREASRHSSPAVQRGIGLLACVTLGATGSQSDPGTVSKARPGHVRLALWACRPRARTTSGAVQGTGFESCVTTALEVGRQWLPLSLCLLQESGSLSSAGISAVARWSLVVPDESVYPAAVAVARASARRMSERRAAAQGMGADEEADVLDEELVPESLVLRALLLAATSGGTDKGNDDGALRGLAMAAAESFLSAVAPRPRLAIVRSAIHRCPFVAGAAALVNVVTRSVAKDWHKAADEIEASSAAAGADGSEGEDPQARALRRHPFAGPEGMFLAEDMARARLNCLSQEVKGMFRQLQKAMDRGKGVAAGEDSTGGSEDLESADGTMRHAAALADQMPVHTACLQSWRLAVGLQRRRPIPGVRPTTVLQSDELQGGYMQSLRRDVSATIDAAVRHRLMPSPAPAIRSDPLPEEPTAEGAPGKAPERVTTDRSSTLFPTEATSAEAPDDAAVGAPIAKGRPTAGSAGARTPRELTDLLLLRHSIDEFLEKLTQAES